MPNRGERDGKGVGGHAAYVKQMMGMGIKLVQLQNAIADLADDDVYVHSLKLVSKSNEADDWLVVLTVDTPDGAKIAFSSGSTIADGLSGLGNRLANNSVKWRNDEYRNKSE